VQIMLLLKLGLVGVVALVACKDSSPPPVAMTPPPLPEAPAPKGLPTTGMVCLGSSGWGWSEDDTVTKLDVLPTASRDGSLYQTWGKLQLLTVPGSPAVPVPAGISNAGSFAAGATSLLVQTKSDHLEVYRGGSWKPVPLPPRDATTSSASRTAIEVDGVWHLVVSERLQRISDAGALEPVETPAGSVRGVFMIGPTLWLVTSVLDITDHFVVFSRRNAAGKFEQVAKVPERAAVATQIVGGPNRAAILLQAGGPGSAYIVDDTGKPTKVVDDPIEELSAFDAAGRLWYRTRDSLVARASDGALTKYGLSTKPMFQGVGISVRCYPVGGGFTKLPGAGAQLTGTLAIQVTGAAGAPFFACDSAHAAGVTPCEKATHKVNGTLDKDGAWKGEVAIGDYTYAIQRDGAWYVPDFRQPNASGNLICDVKAGAECKLAGSMPR
jgi:hypothetical protein